VVLGPVVGDVGDVKPMARGRGAGFVL